jgi:hypothetical protein
MLLAQRLAMQQEVDRLTDLLRQDQDPERMQLIQENISVCVDALDIHLMPHSTEPQGPLDTNDANTRKGHGVRGNRAKHNEGDPNVGYREEESYP